MLVFILIKFNRFNQFKRKLLSNKETSIYFDTTIHGGVELNSYLILLMNKVEQIY